MRFPSLDALVRRAVATAAAFPWTITLAATATIAAILSSGEGADSLAERIAFVAMLGVPLSIALSLATRAWRSTTGYGVLLQIFGLAFLAAFFFGWEGPGRKDEAVAYFQLSAIFHLMVAFLPFLKGGSSGDVWEYNRRLFTAVLKAALFSAVLYFGVLIALAALDKLFGVDFPPRIYLNCWFVAALLISTWIFAGEVDEEITFDEWQGGYPKVMKVFAQYVLTPIVFVYLLILVAYLVKVLATGEWPSGWIGWLVASVAASGLLGFLLVHPLRDDPAEGWIRFYSRVLFIGLIPAALMLLAAFWQRIEPYGLTEMRIVGMLLGLWLLVLAIRFVLRPDTGIRLIPLSLALVLLVTVGGPFGLSHLSVASQGKRFAKMIAADDSAEATEALYFLVDRHAEGEIAKRLGAPMPVIAWDSITSWGMERDSAVTRIMAAVGMKAVRGGGPYGFSRPEMTVVSSGNRRARDVSGYDWAVPVCGYMSGAGTQPSMVRDDFLRVTRSDSTGQVTITSGGAVHHFDLSGIASAPRHPADSTIRVAPDGDSTGAIVLAITSAGIDGSGEGAPRLVSWCGDLLIGDRP